MSSCVEQKRNTEPGTADEYPGVLKGVSLSPKSFEADDFTSFFEKATQAGQVISWAGDWNELANGGPRVLAELASTYNYIPVVEVQFFEQSTGQLLRPLSEETKRIYITSAVSFAETFNPEYVGFGIEINALYQKSPEDFDEFVVLYRDVYDAVKAVAPDTKVFTVFQLERMKGLNGGLFGGKNDPDTAHWFLLDLFKSDIAVFTTYPGIIYKNPSEIPADYYTEIRLYTEKPVAFTEVGWHSSSAIPGWESSESEQAAFVKTFFALTKNMDVELVIWSFLYDQDIFEPFTSMGLYTSEGDAKKAWDIWVHAIYGTNIILLERTCIQEGGSYDTTVPTVRN